MQGFYQETAAFDWGVATNTVAATDTRGPTMLTHLSGQFKGRGLDPPSLAVGAQRLVHVLRRRNGHLLMPTGTTGHYSMIYG